MFLPLKVYSYKQAHIRTIYVTTKHKSNTQSFTSNSNILFLGNGLILPPFCLGISLPLDWVVWPQGDSLDRCVSNSNSAIAVLFIIHTHVNGFTKTNQIVTFCILRNTILK